jgi:hypothetical protein
MIAFEVHFNGEKVCTAGSDGFDALTAGITFNRPKQPAQREAGTYLTLGGVVIQPEEFAHWIYRRLNVGDRVEVRVIETSEVDAPTRRDKPGGRPCAT